MNVKVTVHPPVTVHVAPVSEATQKWGVCAIPLMWQLPDGRHIIMVNGHQDTNSPYYEQEVKDAYYASSDGGRTWKPLPEAEAGKPQFSGSEPPYVRLCDGTWINLAMCPDRKPVNAPPRKKILSANREVHDYVYRWSDLPDDTKAFGFVTYGGDGSRTGWFSAALDFPELETSVIGDGILTDGKSVLETEYKPIENPMLKAYRVIHAIQPLPDGTLVGMTYGQDPSVEDRPFELVYMVVSEDGGRTWKKRGTVGVFDPDMDLGYTYENTMTLAPNGDLLVAMRTEHCVPRDVQRRTDAMFSRSADMGRTWSRPVPLTDSSVTPHLITLKNGVTVFIYGRPGVHMIYSTDSGHTWSDPVTVIGRTLAEHEARGDDYMDCKYWDMDSYANTFAYAVEEDTLLLLYNDMKYQTGDGLDHRATMAGRFTFTVTEAED